MLTQQELKHNVADAAIQTLLPSLDKNTIIGVGTGSTVDLFIDLLAPHRGLFQAAVSSSERSSARLRDHGIPVIDLNQITSMPVYVDGADEIDYQLNMIKGGGGALTREKIVAAVAQQFICIVDESKWVARLGGFPLPVEVVPMATQAVARQLQQWGGTPVLRAGFVTDNGCQILDVAGLNMGEPAQLESRINDIPGVLTCGLFALSGATIALVSTQQGVIRHTA